MITDNMMIYAVAYKTMPIKKLKEDIIDSYFDKDISRIKYIRTSLRCVSMYAVDI